MTFNSTRKAFSLKVNVVSEKRSIITILESNSHISITKIRDSKHSLQNNKQKKTKRLSLCQFQYLVTMGEGIKHKGPGEISIATHVRFYPGAAIYRLMSDSAVDAI